MGRADARPQMGQLTPLSRVPRRFADRYHEWRAHSEGHYLCGNCYFDMLDEEDDSA